MYRNCAGTRRSSLLPPMSAQNSELRTALRFLKKSDIVRLQVKVLRSAVLLCHREGAVGFERSPTEAPSDGWSIHQSLSLLKMDGEAILLGQVSYDVDRVEDQASDVIFRAGGYAEILEKALQI